LNALNLVFMGTSSFALPSLEGLCRSRHRVEAVITRPDRPRGRGHQTTHPPVKKAAMEQHLKIYQPASLKDPGLIEELQRISPQLVVVVDYGKVVPAVIRDLALQGSINLHPSLLPRYRGAAPIQRAVMDGEEKTGLSVICLEEELDSGDIILQQEEPIYLEDTAGDLHRRLSHKGAHLLLEAVDLIARGEEDRIPQDPGKATSAPPLKKIDEMLNWQSTGTELVNQVRGLYPVPGAYTFFRGRRLKVWKASLSSGGCGGEPGEILSLKPEGVEVATRDGSIVLQEVQPEGKKKMDAGSFCRGYQPVTGEKLTSAGE